MSFNRETTLARIRDANDALQGGLEILDFKRDTDFEGIGVKTAYRVDGVHLYAQILDLPSLVDTGASESERAHKKALRFLHLFQRVVHGALNDTGVKKVDFQNERLHAVIYKPLGDERMRIATAVALAQLLQDVLADANSLHGELPNARLSVGLESGVAYAVNNGTRGDREPLFLGPPANRAAKLLGGTVGIYLGARARGVLGTGYQQADPKKAPLSAAQVAALGEEAALGVTAAQLIARWEEALKTTPLAEFTFTRATPPLKNLDFESLSPGASKRMELVALYADVDGFTKFVEACLAKGDAKLLVRMFHVLRKELRDVVNDFEGRKVRYIGDCIHAVLAEGTSQTTDETLSVSRAVLCAAALRDAFDCVCEVIPEAKALGIQIGLELGPVSLTNLGVRGNRDRCSLGLAVSGAQAEQERCDRTQTAIGKAAKGKATAACASLFGADRRATDLRYVYAFETLRAANDAAVKGKHAPQEADVSVKRAWGGP